MSPGKTRHACFLFTCMTQEAAACVLFLFTRRWTHMRNSRAEKQLEDLCGSFNRIIVPFKYRFSQGKYQRKIKDYDGRLQENLPS